MQILLIIIAAIFQIHFTQINDNNRPLIVVLIKKRSLRLISLSDGQILYKPLKIMQIRFPRDDRSLAYSISSSVKHLERVASTWSEDERRTGRNCWHNSGASISSLCICGFLELSIAISRFSLSNPATCMRGNVPYGRENADIRASIVKVSVHLLWLSFSRHRQTTS